MLVVENVSAGYGGPPVIEQVTLQVAPGEFVGLVGPNGCGKTTLLRVIGGILPPCTGEVRLAGNRIREIDRRTLARTIACLPQHFSSDLAFSVRELVLMGRSPYLSRFAGETRRDFETVQQAMDLTDVAHLADRPIPELSGGERQRVLMALCLAQEPEVLLLDEPTSHLDLGHQLSLLDLISRLNRQKGLTVIVVFHDLNLAAEYCQRLFVLNQGRVVVVGTPQEVLTAEMLLELYGASVFVGRNRLSQKPQIGLVAGLNSGSKEVGTSTRADAQEP